jgi:hypothetical protein
MTREEAIREIINGLEEATNEELAAALFGLYQDKRLDNYSVVDE